MIRNHKVIIIGAGPAGLFCSYHLLEKGFQVDLYDQSSGPGKKFLIAGNGGLNLTHSEDLEQFVLNYGKDQDLFTKLLDDFSPTDLRDWCQELGVETFIGTSRRVFPTSLKSAQILLKWMKKLKSYENFKLHLKHRFIKMTKDKELSFKNMNGEFTVQAQRVVFAMGGASWKKTGSDGLWQKALGELDIKVNKFLPMNCGFEKNWSDFFKSEVDRSFLKNIIISFQGKSIKGELMLTPYGIEGGAIYALSNLIRNEIIKKGRAIVSINLRPDLSEDIILKRLKIGKNKSSLSNHLRKVMNFDRSTFILLKELLPDSDLNNFDVLAKKITTLEIELTNTRPIDEAISTSGGICFSELNEFMELQKIPDVYFCGEMLDFEAPTGGYLLQGCFSSAWAVVAGVLKNRNLKLAGAEGLEPPTY